MIERPQLCDNQYAGLMADGETGHILNVDGTVNHGDTIQMFMVFEDIESARFFIKGKQAISNSLEFIVYNSNYEYVECWKAPEWNR